MPGYNTTTTRLTGIQNIFLAEDRPVIQKSLVLDQFGKIISFPMQMGGKSLQIFNDRKLGRGAVVTEETDSLTMQNVNKDFFVLNIFRYWGGARVTEEAIRYIKGNEMDRARSTLRIQAAETIEHFIGREWYLRGFPMLADNDATFFEDGTIKAATSPTTTSFVFTEGSATDFWNGALLTFKTGALKGQTFQVLGTGGSVLAAGDQTITIGNDLNAWMPAAFPQAPAAGDTFRIAVQDGIAATDVLAGANMRRAMGTLLANNAKPHISGPAKGRLAAIITPQMIADALGETAAGGINDLYKYDQGSEPMIKGYVGDAYGFRFFSTTSLIATANTGAQSDTGAVQYPIFFGHNAFCRTKVKGDSTGLQFVIREPKNLNQPIDLFWTVAWEATTGAREYEGLHAVSMPTGQTTLI